MYRSMGSVRAILGDLPGGTALLEAIELGEANGEATFGGAYPLDFLEQIYVLHWQVRDRPDGLFVALALAFEGELVLAVPGFDPLAVALGSNVPGYTILSGSMLLGQTSRLALHHLQMALRWQQDWLRPATLDPEGMAPESFEVQVRGSLSVDENLNIQPALEDFSIPPFAVGETGLILGLEGCRLNLSRSESPAEVVALDYDESFLGVYAHTADLHWLPQATFAGLPGLRLTLNDVALGTDGVSFDAALAWNVVHDGQAFQAGTEFLGHLLNPAWELALERVEGTVRRNFPQRFIVAGMMHVPPLETLLSVEFGLRQVNGGFETAFSLAKAVDAAPFSLALGQATITVEQLQLSGALAGEAFSLNGLLGGRVELPGYDLHVASAAASFAHHESEDFLDITLSDVDFGPLGDVETAMLCLRAYLDDAGHHQWSVAMETTLSWADIHNRMQLDTLPDIFPLPPDDATIKARLAWESAPSTKVQLTFDAEVTDRDALWPFLPVAYRPEVLEDARFTFAATVYDSVNDFQGGNGDSSFQGEAAVQMTLRLPALPPAPGVEHLTVMTGNRAGENGDEEGIVEVRLVAGMRPAAGSDPEPFLELEIANPVTIDVNFPGLPQPQPAIHTAITRVALDLDGTSDLAGTFTMEGAFALRPVQPPPELPFASHLESMLAPVGLSDLSGTASFTVTVEGDKGMMSLDCAFDDAEIVVDVFDMLAGLTTGMGGEGEGTGALLDVDVGFGLRGVSLRLGSLADDVEEGQFSLEMVIALSLAGMEMALFFQLSEQAFVLGLEEDFPVPLALGEFPLAPADLQPLEDGSGKWTLARWDGRLDDIEAAIAGLHDDGPDKRHKSFLQGQRFLLQNMRNNFTLLSGEPERNAYQGYVETLVAALHATTSFLHVDTGLSLALSGRRRADGSGNEHGVRFEMPFADPRNIGVHGAAHLTGFADDDPFKGLEGVQLSLGLSADMIFFSVDSLAAPIEIPAVGRYDGGRINLSRLHIGYGYTKNSLAVNIAGDVQFPDQLVEDADTSDLLGAGIRLPTDTALGFRLDLIPVTLGPVDFIIPLFEFDLDMRAPESQALVSSENCEPYWDGLQTIVPGIYHDALKHLAFSPVFGFFILPNLRVDGDVMIGDENNGLTVIYDNVLVLFGYWSGYVPVPVPFFADPLQPYFDNLCVNLRLAGFGINFNLQRPFPTLSPLALFEVLALLADPGYPIEPRGHLADTMRISLTDARITMPEEVARLFPGVAGIINKTLEVTINLGTFITMLQAVVPVVREVGEAIEEGGHSLESRLQALTQHPPDFSPGALVAALPPDLRKFRLSGSFAGFSANVVLLLIDAADNAGLQAEMALRDNPQPPPTTPTLDLGSPVDATELARFRPNLPETTRTHYPDDPATSLFQGIEFAHFEAADLDAIPPPPGDRPLAGVLAGAHVRLPTGQRFRFLGAVYEDGSFALISAAEVSPLTLKVAGLAISLPFEAAGRMTLAGRQKRDGYYGGITAAGYGIWNVLPGIARVIVASRTRPAQLKLYSDGRFAIAGNVRVELFNGAASVTGDVRISETHCLVRGELHYQAGQIVDLVLETRGRIGPGSHLLLRGEGTLIFLNLTGMEVRAEISEQRATFEGFLDTKRWQVAGVEVNCYLQLALRGSIDLWRKKQPAFLLEGQGQVNIFGAGINGRGGVKRVNKRLSVYMEGALTWQGREWVEGRIELSPDGVRLCGRTSFAFNLTPSNLAGTELTHLYFRVALGGEFVLDASAGLASFALEGDWTLGVRLTGEDGQVFPLASKKLSLGGGATLEEVLLDIAGFVPVPFGNLQIPLPVLEDETLVRLGSVGGDFALSWDRHRLVVDDTLFVPLPVYSQGQLNNAQTKAEIVTYTLSLDDEDPIVVDLSVDTGLKLSLIWRNDELQLKIERDDEVQFRRLAA